MRSLSKICFVFAIILLLPSVAWADPLLDCSNAVPLNCGDTIQGDNTNSPANATFDGCWNGYWNGPEDVYEVNLVEGDVIQVQLTTETSPAWGVFLLASCDEMDCLAFGANYFNVSFQTGVPATGTYYLWVDVNAIEGAPYTLSLDCFSPEPPPANDTCEGAACLPPGQDNGFAGSLMWAIDEFWSLWCDGFGADGVDVYYKFGLDDGDTFTAEVDGDPFTDVTLFIVTNCNNPADTCVAGADAGSPGMPETISYTQTSGGPTVYYLLVKEWAYNYQSASFTGVYSHDGLLCDDPVATEETTWGSLKAIFR